MALQDWKLKVKSKATFGFITKDRSQIVFVAKTYKSTKWSVWTKSPLDSYPIKEFRLKSKALKYAKNYMKVH